MKYAAAMQQAKRQYWRNLLLETSGNVAKAARVAGVSRTTLHGALVKLGLRQKQANSRELFR